MLFGGLILSGCIKEVLFCLYSHNFTWKKVENFTKGGLILLLVQLVIFVVNQLQTLTSNFLSQVGHLGEDYQEWVHQPIVSKEGPRFFESDFWEVWESLLVFRISDFPPKFK